MIKNIIASTIADKQAEIKIILKASSADTFFLLKNKR